MKYRTPIILLAIVALVILCGLWANKAHAYTPGESAAQTQFLRSNPCPTTGKSEMPCLYWQIDRKRPACSLERETSGNLRWSRLDTASRKNREEAGLCSLVRKGVISKSATNAEICARREMGEWPRLRSAMCSIN